MRLLEKNAKQENLCYRVRHAMGINQREFAKLCGVTQMTIYKWEKGEWMTDQNQRLLRLLAAQHGMK